MNSYIIGFTIGYTASRFGYGFTHQRGFPELGRYAFGVALIVMASGAFGIPREYREKFLLAALSVGAGVAIARITT